MKDRSNAHTSGREHTYSEIIPVYAPAAFRRQAAQASKFAETSRSLTPI